MTGRGKEAGRRTTERESGRGGGPCALALSYAFWKGAKGMLAILLAAFCLWFVLTLCRAASAGDAQMLDAGEREPDEAAADGA